MNREAARLALMARVLDEAATTLPSWRRAAANLEKGAGLPEALEQLVEKVERRAFEITDEEIAELRKHHSDSELFAASISKRRRCPF